MNRENETSLDIKNELNKTIEKHANGEQYSHISSIKDRVLSKIKLDELQK